MLNNNHKNATQTLAGECGNQNLNNKILAMTNFKLKKVFKEFKNSDYKIGLKKGFPLFISKK
jgi:predicted nucleic-acid-binding Zn-ribbon protein